MKDLVYENNQNRKEWDNNIDSLFADVETLVKYKNNPDAVYQIVTEYDMNDGYDVSIRTTRNLDKASEILRNEFLKEHSNFCEDPHCDEEDIKPFKDMFGNEYNTLKDTYAILDLCGEYITIYITVNIIE